MTTARSRFPVAPPARTWRHGLGLGLAVIAVLAAAAPPGALAQRVDFALGAHRLHGLRPDLAALLLAGHDAGAVDLAAVALPLPGAGPTVPVSLFIEVDGTSLLGPTPAAAPRFEVYAYAVDAGGGVRGFLAEGIDLDLEQMGEAIYSGGFKFVGALNLPPGSYSLRLLVNEPASQRYGVRAVPLELPAPAGAAGTASEAAGAAGPARIVAPPLFAEPPGSWVLVGDAPTADHPQSGIAAVAASNASLPSAQPVISGDRGAVLELLTRNVPAGEPTPSAVLTDAEGRAHPIAARFVSRAAADVPGLERIRLAIAPTGVEPGHYHLEMALTAGGQRLAAPPLAIVVAAAGGGDEDGRTWASLGGRVGAPAAGPDLSRVRTGRRGPLSDRALSALANAYREALARLPVGDEGPEAMMAFETGALGKLGDDVGKLDDGELAMLGQLAKRDPNALVPAVALHLDLYARYLTVKNYYLAVHSRDLVERISELYARSASDDGSRALVARALTRLGVALQEAQLVARARTLLEKAVTYDSKDPTALLALSLGDEKLGEYGKAVVSLKRLVEVDPKSAEGRLRLAINLDRTGDPAAGRALLRRLVAEDNPRWVLSLAYQQLARERLDAGAPAEAAHLLAEAVDRLPGDGRLEIALAYARDRAGDPAAARAAVDRLVATGWRDGPTPRLRYNEWPEEGAERSAELLRRNARARLGALAAALDSLDGGKGR